MRTAIVKKFNTGVKRCKCGLLPVLNVHGSMWEHKFSFECVACKRDVDELSKTVKEAAAVWNLLQQKSL